MHRLWTNVLLVEISLNPFPHADILWRFCSRQLLKQCAAKREIAYNVQFLLLPQCFQLDSSIILSFTEILHIFAKIFSKSSAADLLYLGMGWYLLMQTSVGFWFRALLRIWMKSLCQIVTLSSCIILCYENWFQH